MPPCYGGRASDKLIIKDCGSINLVEPYDQVMADRGFKIHEELMMQQATLAIPPNTVVKLQMSSEDVHEISRIANVRIYIGQAIGRTANNERNELPIHCLPMISSLFVVHYVTI